MTGRAPRERGAGTLAALEHGLRHGGNIFRLHDIDAAADYLKVRGALESGGRDLAGLALDDAVRHEPPAA